MPGRQARQWGGHRGGSPCPQELEGKGLPGGGAAPTLVLTGLCQEGRGHRARVLAAPSSSPPGGCWVPPGSARPHPSVPLQMVWVQLVASGCAAPRRESVFRWQEGAKNGLSCAAGGGGRAGDRGFAAAAPMGAWLSPGPPRRRARAFAVIKFAFNCTLSHGHPALPMSPPSPRPFLKELVA